MRPKDVRFFDGEAEQVTSACIVFLPNRSLEDPTKKKKRDDEVGRAVGLSWANGNSWDVNVVIGIRRLAMFPVSSP